MVLGGRQIRVGVTVAVMVSVAFTGTLTVRPCGRQIGVEVTLIVRVGVRSWGVGRLGLVA